MCYIQGFGLEKEYESHLLEVELELLVEKQLYSCAYIRLFLK